MFNLEQIQNRLQNPSVTDQHLIHYVQNPNGQVPSVLALAEIKRRQELRASKTPQEQAQNMMQPTVADKVIAQDTQANIGPDFRSQGLPAIDQQAQAQRSMGQGISDLTLPETMYDEKNYASGGIVAFADGGETGMNLDELPTLNVNTGAQSYGNSNTPEGLQKLMTGFRMAGESPNINPGTRVFSRMMSGALRGDPGMLGMFQGKGAPSSLIEGIDYNDYYARNPDQYLPGYTPTAPAFSINPSSGNTSAQNSAFVNRRAKGGYLDGAGDGMSDSIPATIEGKQPARLADGEFVIPADVVSHIGNGSSKAGSKQLYSMLDRIRKARTGHTKQGKEIKPQKYMPA